MSNQTASFVASPVIGIETFLTLVGRGRTDKSAGFRHWIKTRKVRRRTKVEWDSLWAEYQNRSIK